MDGRHAVCGHRRQVDFVSNGRAYPAMAFEMSESGVSAATTSDLPEKPQKGIREMCKDLPLFRSMLADSKGPTLS
jgi:hypothetical protein